ncbi:hypothetical protein [Mesorhizobium sp. L2C067A000]|uniref:hypothetical protein n=1 Tax=Mesorhizobium sp. L2C067A000 TaxID=1287106 RepID=UPI0003CF9D7F|nr:hypothetical protein [Mesorhizobium sp. L2C067A000]ESZ33850.1 hypothetical protein X733_13695 [Mesorhizobium sp. L2C067A000]
MDQTSPWVPQEDGTQLPSAQLAKAYRENPDQFPNFIDDAVALSGKTREEVQAIVDNPYAAGNTFGGSVLGPIAKMVTMPDIRKGAAEAGAVAASKLGFDGAAQTMQDYSDSVNPEFSTEKEFGENIAEVAGQAAPAAGGALAAGGVVPAAIVGAGISTLTFSDEDNIQNLANDYVDGAVPDFLVVNPQDSQEAKTAKNFATNLIVDLATAGLSHAIGGVYRAVKGVPDGFVDMNSLKQIGDANGIPLRDTPASAETAQTVVKDVARKAADDIPPPVESASLRNKVAKDAIIADITEKDFGKPIIKTEAEAAPIPQDVATDLRQRLLGPIKALEERVAQYNTKTGVREIVGEEPGLKYSAHAEQVASAIHRKDTDAIIRLTKEIDKLPAAATVGHEYKTAVLRMALEGVEDNLDEIIRRIREDPSLKTKATWKSLSADYYQSKGVLAEMYREIGTSSSYAFHLRQGRRFDDRTLQMFDEAEKEMQAKVKEGLGEGYHLFSSKAEFIAANAYKLEEMGFSTLDVLDDLYKMFDEFDAQRAGVIDNLNSNRLARLSKSEREALEGSFLRYLNDMRASAMLGQVSTASLEALSNTMNNALLPISQHLLRGDVKRAWREYAGYAAATARGFKAMKDVYVTGRSLDHTQDLFDGANHGGGKAIKKDFKTLADDKKYVQYMFYRMWDFAATLAHAASEGSKVWRAAGVAYADGYDLALKSGATRPNAKKLARDYAASMFDEKGAISNAALKIDVASTSWQSAFDTRYGLGKLAQFADNLRNHPNPIVNAFAQGSIPFWRTLVNISSNSMQTVQPIPASVLTLLGKTRWGAKLVGGMIKDETGKLVQAPGLVKFMSDFSGINGLAAKQRAIGRQRLGYLTLGAGWALMESGQIDITGPAGYKGWDAKMAQMQEYPASSIIVGGHAVDLTRLLPYSAPLMLLGVLKDMQRENALQMKNGNYVADNDSAFSYATTYGSALGYLSLNLMSDASGLRGIGDLWDTLAKVAKEGDPRALLTFAENYVKAFTPGAVRMAGKNQGAVTGDWTQDSAEGFLNEVLASAGFHTGYTRLDFLGKPVEDPLRGMDPLNSKPVKTDDPLRAEYVRLNKLGDLGLSLDRPDGVFDAAYWKGLGVQPSKLDWLTRSEAPSLTKMKTVDGANAWDRYRDLVYKGRADKDLLKSTASVGDRIDIGKVLIKKGENFEDTLRRTIDSQGYKSLTPDAQVKVFKTIFGAFTKNAKDYLKHNLVVDPTIFTDDRYGVRLPSPDTLDVTEKVAKGIGAQVQRTRGSTLDDIFAIK